MQLSLFDSPTLPPHVNTDTSRAASVAIAPVTGELRRKVYEYIQSQGQHGATDLEIQAALGMDGNTERPRRRELEKAKRIVDSGERRKTASGRYAVVWVAK